ncbi:hypothetical protein IFR04_015703 [Cadophora malorum]|uniref:Uncharacterized protein n=1 Tax=Cadophora malorum TaxID=108018 RepID=A0A8H7W3P8_9HELO|nr:hypothetical protein IFR04_015703 [Cadophora malorum]
MPRIPRGVNQESHYLFHYEQTFAEITRQQIDHWHFIKVRDGNEVSSSFIPMRVSPPRVSFDFNVDTLVLKPPMLDPSRRYGREGFDKLRYVALYRVEFTGDLQQDHRWFATHLCWTQHNLIHLMYECFDTIRMICLIISDEDESWFPVMKEKYAKFGYRITKMQKHSFAATAVKTIDIIDDDTRARLRAEFVEHWKDKEPETKPTHNPHDRISNLIFNVGHSDKPKTNASSPNATPMDRNTALIEQALEQMFSSQANTNS